jgi:hypothetical protein
VYVHTVLQLHYVKCSVMSYDLNVLLKNLLVNLSAGCYSLANKVSGSVVIQPHDCAGGGGGGRGL